MKRSTPKDRHIGAKAKAYRLQNHGSQAELAAKLQMQGCDLSRGMIGQIEIGCRAVSVFEIDKFVEVFGIAYDDLSAK